MTNHPENDGSHYYTPHSTEVLKEAERVIQFGRIKYWVAKLGKGALLMTASYGMTPEMYTELRRKSE